MSHPIIECWCCGQRRRHKGRDLCSGCYSRWRRRGFTGPGPGPSQRPPMADSAREYAALIALPKSAAARQLGVSVRTVERWRQALREAS